MFQEEAVLREILCEALNGKKIEQERISQVLRISIGLVNKTVSKLDQIGAVSKEGRSYLVIAFEKILTYWASIHNLRRDLIYWTGVLEPVREIERNLPGGVIFSAYTAFNHLFNEVPSDYSEVWVYVPPDLLPEVKERFPSNNLPVNLYVLKSDDLLRDNSRRYSGGRNIVSIPQLYADLWNIPTWYSKEYINSLESKLREMKDGILE
jgi:hypothetical protein